MADIQKLKELAMAAKQGGSSDAQIWNFVNQVTPSAILELIARAEAAEAQLSALAKQEPVGAFHIYDGRVDGTTDYVRDGEWPIDEGELLVYARAAPPAPFVVDSKSFERGLFILNETLDDCGDSERGLLLALTKMGVEVQGE